MIYRNVRRVEVDFDIVMTRLKSTQDNLGHVTRTI